MHISPLEEYGLRCALTLAHHYKKQPISARFISAEEGISIEYVSKVMFLLRKSGVALATRGKNGGFQLSQDPRLIKLETVINSFSQKKDKASHFCNHFSGKNQECVRIKNCSIRPMWNILTQTMDSLFHNVSLGDLLSEEFHTQKNITKILQKSLSSSSEERMIVL